MRFISARIIFCSIEEKWKHTWNSGTTWARIYPVRNTGSCKLPNKQKTFQHFYQTSIENTNFLDESLTWWSDITFTIIIFIRFVKTIFISITYSLSINAFSIITCEFSSGITTFSIFTFIRFIWTINMAITKILKGYALLLIMTSKLIFITFLNRILNVC